MEGEFRPLTDHIEQPSERLRNMVATHHHSCTLCEATCGITVTTDGDRVVDVRGDEHDPISRGYICPKATALADLHHDPDRLKRPLVKRDGEFVEVSWREAFDLVGDRLRAIRAKYGKHALGVYYGNPAAHNLGLMLFGIPLFRSLGTRNVFAATSVDRSEEHTSELQSRRDLVCRLLL